VWSMAKEKRVRGGERREGRRKATQRSNFCADLVRILVPHVLYFFTQFAFFAILYLVMLCENTILISFYRTLIIECLVLVVLDFFNFFWRFYYMLHIFFLSFLIEITSV